MTKNHLDHHEDSSVKTGKNKISSLFILSSLVLALNAQGQNTSASDTTPFKTKPDEIVSDSRLNASLGYALNEIADPGVSQQQREKLIKDFLANVNFAFEIPKDHIYIKRNLIITKAENFLNSFYKESYRDAKKLKVFIKSISLQDKKLYIDIEYLYNNTSRGNE